MPTPVPSSGPPIHLLLLAATTIAASAQHTTPPPPVTFHTATQVEFLAPTGTAWMLQTSTSTGTGTAPDQWQDIAGPFWGNGTAQHTHLPRQHSGKTYRLRPADPVADHHAPTTLQSHTVLLQHGSSTMECVFLPRGQGFIRFNKDSARLHTYQWQRTSPTAGLATLTCKNGTILKLHLDYQIKGLGTWTLTTHSSATSTTPLDTQKGTFSQTPGRINYLGARTLPTTLLGQTIVTTVGGQSVLLHFSSDTTGTLTRPDGTTAPFSYEYDLGDATTGNQLAVTVDSLLTTYTLTPGPGGSGTFTSTTADTSSTTGGDSTGLGSSSGGSFSLKPPPPPPSEISCDLAGQKITFTGSKTLKICFYADGTGLVECIENGQSQLSGFTYDSADSSNSGREVALIFPGSVSDRVDTIHMDFNAECQGSYRRTNYENGGATPDGGGFSPSGGL